MKLPPRLAGWIRAALRASADLAAETPMGEERITFDDAKRDTRRPPR